MTQMQHALITSILFLNHLKLNCYARIKHSAIGKSSGNVDDYRELQLI